MAELLEDLPNSCYSRGTTSGFKTSYKVAKTVYVGSAVRFVVIQPHETQTYLFRVRRSVTYVNGNNRYARADTAVRPYAEDLFR